MAQSSELRPVAPVVIPRLRWYICTLLFFASAINYMDRQTVAVLKPHLQTVLHWSESDYGWIVFGFQLAYAIFMIVWGTVIDRLGTRLGLALAMAWWSIAAMGHALARSATGFGVARFVMGAGEAANFPASIKAAAEWFPVRERAFATGIFNAGTNVGAMLAPPLVVWLTLTWSWQLAFIATGSLGLIWLVFWLMTYRPHRQPPKISQHGTQLLDRDASNIGNQPEPKIPWQRLLGYRQAWGFVAAKFMTDPIWWFYVYWLPSYLRQERGFSLREIGYFAWIPFLAADAGSVAGGWLSGFLIKQRWSVNGARKTAMLACALCMPAGLGALFMPNPALALALISIATSGHQGWSANVFTLASDMFPQKDVATVVGMGGTGGAVGGMILALAAGYILQWFHSYAPLFLLAGIMHPLAMGVVQLLIPRIQPVETATRN